MTESTLPPMTVRRRPWMMRALPVALSIIFSLAAYKASSLILSFLAGWFACAAYSGPAFEPQPYTADQIVDAINAEQARDAARGNR